MESQTNAITDYTNHKAIKLIKPKDKLVVIIMNIILLSFLHNTSLALFKFFENKNLTNTLKESFKYFQKLYLLIALLIVNIIYITLYKLKLPYFEKMKSNNLPWPWEENKEKFRKDLKKIVFLYFFNITVVSNIFLMFFGRFIKCRYNNQYPSVLESFLGIIIFTFFEDFGFYWGHRLFHIPFLYSRIHKVHHKIYNVFHLACIYTHPLEYFFGNLLPSIMGVCVFGPNFHLVTFTAFLGWRIIRTHEAHGGYDFFYSVFRMFPKGIDANFHDFHHLKNIGNFGSFFSIWDDLFGTSKDYWKKLG